MRLSFPILVMIFLITGISLSQASDGILRDSHGLILYMTQNEAMKACPTASHLPTIRELAMKAHALGANGILEVNQVSADAIPAGYDKIFAFNLNGREDEFYYSNRNYEPPFLGDLGDNWFWSSSVVSNDAYNVYALDGQYGDLINFSRGGATLAVLCISDR